MEKLLLLFFLFFISWMIPPVLGTAGLSLMGVLLAQDVSGVVLTLVIALGTIASYIPIWYFVGFIQKRIQQKREKKESVSFEKEDDPLDDQKKGVLKRIYEFFVETFHKAHETKEFKKLSSFMETKTGKYVAFGGAVLLCSPLGSNFISMLILRKRMSVKIIVPAVLVGETLGAIAFVYGGTLVKHVASLL